MSSVFEFAHHLFQPCGIGRAGDQSAQLGGNRCGTVFIFDRLCFPRWLSLAVSQQLGRSGAAQIAGGHVFSVNSSRVPLSSRKTRELQSGCRRGPARCLGVRWAGPDHRRRGDSVRDDLARALICCAATVYCYRPNSLWRLRPATRVLDPQCSQK